MKMIVGLGNIGPQYDGTRHNMGFMVIDQIAKDYQLTFKHTSKMEAMTASGIIKGEKVLLVKPTTFMNESGRSVKPLMDYYDVPVEDLIVIHDDMDLPLGKIRLKAKGSAAGHNGLKSLINHLGTQGFHRVKVGIDHPGKASVVDYVLGKFKKDEQEGLLDNLDQAEHAVEDWIEGTTFAQLMNKYN